MGRHERMPCMQWEDMRECLVCILSYIVYTNVKADFFSRKILPGKKSQIMKHQSISQTCTSPVSPDHLEE